MYARSLVWIQFIQPAPGLLAQSVAKSNNFNPVESFEGDSLMPMTLI
jgi:hypothetical protein